MTGSMMTTRRRNLVSFALTAHTYSGSSTAETNPEPPPAIIRGVGYARFTLKNTGALFWETSNDDGTGNGNAVLDSGNVTGEWMVGAVASEYEVQVVATGTALSSGSATNGSGVWNALGTDRLYQRSTSTSTFTTTSCVVTVRRISDQVTMCTATITLTLN